MAKEKKAEEGAPGWIVTFADLMSLLLTFFVLLLSFADTNIKKFRDVSGSIREAFGVQTIAYYNRKPSSTTHFENAFGAAGQEWEKFTFDPSMMGIEFESFCKLEKQQIESENHTLQFVEKQIRDDLVRADLQQYADTELVLNVLKVRLKFSSFFKPGASTWVDGGLERFAKLISLIDKNDNDLVLMLSSFSPNKLNEDNIGPWSLKSQRTLTLLGILKQTRLNKIKKIEHHDQPMGNYGETFENFEFRIKLTPPKY